MRNVKALALAGSIAALAAGALPAGAGAHVSVKSSSPKAGKTASTAIRSVSVTFSGRLLTGTVKVTGPGGTASVGRGRRDARNHRRLKVALKRGLRAGAYTVRWRMMSTDGHPQSGSFGFTLRRPRR